MVDLPRRPRVESCSKGSNNGRGFPVCDESMVKTMQLQKVSSLDDISFIIKPNSMSEIEPLETIFGADFRKAKRFKTATTATIEIPSTGHWFYAGLKNFSSGGMSFETDASIRPGANIEINLDKPIFQSDQKKYNSRVRWCRKLEADDKEQFNFGIGSKFI